MHDQPKVQGPIPARPTRPPEPPPARRASASWPGWPPPVTDVQRLTIQPGERLIVRGDFAQDDVSDDSIREVKARLRAALQLPESVAMVLMDRNWHVMVASGEDPAPPMPDAPDLLRIPCHDMTVHAPHTWLAGPDKNAAWCQGRQVRGLPDGAHG